MLTLLHSRKTYINHNPKMKNNYTKLVEANVSIAESLKVLAENQKQINDFNILHAERVSQEHNTILDKLNVFVTKYWYLLVAVICGAFALVGVKLFLS